MQDFNVCQPRELIYGITKKFKAYPTVSKPTHLFKNNNLDKYKIDEHTGWYSVSFS